MSNKVVVKLYGSDPKDKIKDSLKYGPEHKYLPNFLKYLGESVGAYEPKAKVQVLNEDDVAANATVTVAFASMTDGDTIQIGSMILTAKASSPGNNQFLIDVSNSATAVNLAQAIASFSSGLLSSSANGAVVSVSAIVSGPIGNMIPIIITQTSSGMVASSSALINGAYDSSVPQSFNSF